MKDLHTQEQIDEMRKRLYDRGTEVTKKIRHKLSDNPVDVSRDWNTGKPTTSENTTDLRKSMPAETPKEDVNEASKEDIVVVPPKKKRHYRTFVMLGSLGIFLIVAIISSIHLYLGNNQISKEKIDFTITGPTSISGGERSEFEVTISNQNDVTIESVTLIMKYPLGTKSIEDSPRELYEERIPVEDIGPDETINIQIPIAIFGEENSQKSIEATLEYRTDGSNSVFTKNSNVIGLNIISSPIVLRVENIQKVASGQLVDVTLTAISNASEPLNNILITAAYPNGFSFESSDPDPVYGQNVWRVDELLPEEEVEIKLKGIVTGLTEEEMRINFEAGAAKPDNQYLVGATLAESRADFTIERPFLDVQITINNDKDRNVIIPEGEVSEVVVDVTNTLDETVYDMAIEVVPEGNALDENSIVRGSGFYDSNTGTVRWEVANNASFERVLPGDSRSLVFSVAPGSNRTTASFNLVVNVYVRRVAESSAQETLIGSVTAEAKYSSKITLGSQAGRNVGQFTDSGPIPPKVGETTTYTLVLVAEAGANDVANTIVKTSLPVYVNWLNQYNGEGEVTYNSVSKEIEWSVGKIDSGQRKEMAFQVDIKPSTSQVKRIPVLLNRQYLRSNDSYTGALLQAEALAITTELSTEMGFELDNGVVVR